VSRLKPLDRVIVLFILPVWAIFFVLHVNNAIHGGRLSEPGIYVLGSEDPDGYPVVRSLRAATPAGSSGLQLGDELLRIGDSDLRGIGPLRFFAHAMRAVSPDYQAPLVYRRDGQTHEMLFPFTPLPLPIRFIVVSLCCVGVGLLLVLRAPRNPTASAVFRGMLFFGAGFLRPWGGPLGQTYFWMAMGVIICPFFAPLLIFAARQFRDNYRANWFEKLFPWFFIPVGPLYIFGIIGVPLSRGSSNLAEIAAMVMLFMLGLALIVELTISYRRATRLGKRQIKWVVYGMYISMVPVLIATAISLSDPELWWLSDASEILEALIPLSFFFAVARYGAYDIDRIISVTASYSLLVLIGVPILLTLTPALADLVSQALGVDPWPGRLFLSVGVASAAIPTHRYLNPQLDRWFFPERHEFEERVLELLEELSQLDSPNALITRASARVDELLRPESCASYLRTAEGYANIFARGRGVLPMLDDRNPAIGVLATRGKPLVAERWAKFDRRSPMTAFDRAALESLDAAVLVPVSRRQDLMGFACLGPKQSGDIYTATDLALLGTIGSRVAAELVRFDTDELVRQGQEMQEALRRYVPGAVADELGTSKQMRSERCEVSVLFVDIRGYSAFSESRSPEQVFALINQYTEAVSQVIREHSGSVVEFNGDGMMAVFGAPHELPSKERSAVEAARAIPTAVAAIRSAGADEAGPGFAVGVGVATGEAFVGNIRAVDRLIWSAIGNTTNRASRLEALTRDLEASIVIDADTWKNAGAICSDFEPRQDIMIRGYSEPSDVYLLPL
jgi:class 3 adenylate cyclase